MLATENFININNAKMTQLLNNAQLQHKSGCIIIIEGESWLLVAVTLHQVIFKAKPKSK